MINFQKLDPSQRETYNQILFSCPHRGCEYSFANLSLWGLQKVAFLHGCVAFFSHFYGRSVYPYPIGAGDRKAVIEEILRDAEERGLPCRITGITETDRAELESWFPGKFLVKATRNGSDYVYAIDDLADLKGKRFQPKRNHINRFLLEYPDAQIRPLSDETLPDAKALADRWHQRRSPEEDAGMELVALNRAFAHWKELGMEGLVMYVGSQVVAMTMGSRLAEDTVDVHFEKADTDYPGAYAVINRAFARHIREKYPQVQYLNREEDMGIEGLRKAKLSYHPHHLVEKCWAHLMTEEFHDY